MKAHSFFMMLALVNVVFSDSDGHNELRTGAFFKLTSSVFGSSATEDTRDTTNSGNNNVDGGWGNWTACNATCGAGTQRRACDNPAPEHDGDDCDGEPFQECQTGVDCVDGGWGNWTACNATCGTGTQIRACDNPAPENDGDDCDGEPSQECDTEVVCVDGGWGNWTACNATCGTGEQTRACDNPAPENGGDVCHGETSQVCDTGVECVNGGWGDWDACDVTCGGKGTQTRACDNPVPKDGGTVCDGDTFQECDTDVECVVQCEEHRDVAITEENGKCKCATDSTVNDCNVGQYCYTYGNSTDLWVCSNNPKHMNNGM